MLNSVSVVFEKEDLINLNENNEKQTNKQTNKNCYIILDVN